MKDMGTRAAWTPERRAKQAEAIRRWKPWEQSSGPTTASGKSASSQNAYKGGAWIAERANQKQVNAQFRGLRLLMREPRLKRQLTSSEEAQYRDETMRFYLRALGEQEG